MKALEDGNERVKADVQRIAGAIPKTAQGMAVFQSFIYNSKNRRIVWTYPTHSVHGYVGTKQCCKYKHLLLLSAPFHDQP